MNSEISKLASLRESIAELKAEKDALIRAVTEGIAYQSLDDQLKQLQETEGVVAETVRAQALGQFLADHNKKPGNGVEIKTFTVLHYNPVEALAYCKSSLPAALSLNVKSFEAVAKTGALPETVVKIAEENRVQIASDLSAYLKE